MTLRFQEANGRNFDDPFSDSSWAPFEIKDLDSNQGSHIQPGRLKSAVQKNMVKDLDNYFKANEVKSEEQLLNEQINALMAQVNSTKTTMSDMNKRLKDEATKTVDGKKVYVDAAAQTIADQLPKYNKNLSDLMKQITEKQQVLAGIIKKREEAEAASQKSKEDEEKAIAEAAAKAEADAKAAADAKAIEDAKIAEEKAAADAVAEEAAKASFEAAAKLGGEPLVAEETPAAPLGAVVVAEGADEGHEEIAVPFGETK